MSKNKISAELSSPNGQFDADKALQEMMADIPDFTPEQWADLQAETRELETGYVPTRSLIPGL